MKRLNGSGLPIRMQRLILNKEIKNLIKAALLEDVGKGDLSSAIIPAYTEGKGYIIAGEDLVLAGIRISEWTFKNVDRKIKFIAYKKDGEWVKKNERIAEVSGNARNILTAERTALNFLQRLSGIATLTRKFVEKLKNTGVVLLDTRKTTPGLRLLEKYATRVGGARNHRMGLYDRLMIKSNHVNISGGIENVVGSVKKLGKLKDAMFEVRNISELKTAIAGGARYILLDNMSLKELRKAVSIAKRRAKLEATGGVNLGNIKKIAQTGVDFISVGALTHSARWVNISLKMVKNG